MENKENNSPELKKKFTLEYQTLSGNCINRIFSDHTEYHFLLPDLPL